MFNLFHTGPRILFSLFVFSPSSLSLLISFVAERKHTMWNCLDLTTCILKFHERGPWEPVCRLVCSKWASILSGCTTPNWYPYEEIISRKDPILFRWAQKMAKIPWSPLALCKCLAVPRMDALLWYQGLVGATMLRSREKIMLSRTLLQKSEAFLSMEYAVLTTDFFFRWRGCHLLDAIRYHGADGAHV